MSNFPPPVDKTAEVALEPVDSQPCFPWPESVAAYEATRAAVDYGRHKFLPRTGPADGRPARRHGPDDGGVRLALRTISDWLETLEGGQLRERLLARNYAVIRPVSLTSPPPARTLADIAAAIGVLDEHALVIARED